MQAFLNKHSNTLMQAMPLVQNYEKRLDSLNNWWGKIALIGKINSHNIASTILEDMQRTKDKFGELQNKLTDNLLLENLQKLTLDNASKAQVAVDILIRNLFERTADVGFLATDDDIRSFLSATGDIDESFIALRLQEYVKKYSVYDEIIILDTHGNVRAHLDHANPIKHSKDALIRETLNSDTEYVETFRYSDLQSNKPHSLIYSSKITATNDAASEVLGVLCLCFRFDDEMTGIFDNLMRPDDIGVLMILDKRGKVIASSDNNKIPPAATLNTHDPLSIVTFKGQKYITSTCRTNGYQGFFGLGWRGQMMTPLNLAFKDDQKQRDNGRNYAEIINQASHFTPELKEIRQASLDVNTDLSLLVLNGQITSARKNAAEFMPVLDAIKKIGSDIADIFTESVDSLQEVTVMSSHLDNAGFLAALAVDIMDRNLYERANDCRWWALTTEFRRILNQAEINNEDKQHIANILCYINDLYTVYTNLYVYDQKGEILAVSNPSEQHIVGQLLPEQTAAYNALRIHDSQQYAVSPFVESSFYGGRHTYIYNASISELNHSANILGGIGIVFDSEPQFRSMLEDALPRNKKGRLIDGCFALFADRQQTIIAVANHAELRSGARLELAERYFNLTAGQRASEVIDYQGKKYILGIAVSQGYREYKTVDNYRNDVVCLLFIPF
ncbi:cache domain-containing protein [Methylomarinum sp. Ch1-1]|uniref:Cache domain-containing protein n=1 Tax=Methylomarinum roseum TaxID=3067653 RepID=A0AAU7NQA0_9GAMM